MQKLTPEELALMLLADNDDVQAFEVFQTPWCDMVSLASAFQSLGYFVKRERRRSSMIVIREHGMSQYVH